MGFLWMALLILAEMCGAENKPTANEDCSTMMRFNPLPGHGWDILREKEMGRAIAINYSKCQKTMDDMSVVIPDGTIMTPIRNSDVQLYTEFFDHWKNYTSITSFSMSVGGGLSANLFDLDASFSYDYEHMKQSQIEDKSVTTRVQARYVLYTVRFESPLAVELDPDLKKICLDAINQISANNSERAEMIAELIVQNYGTHVVLKVDVGGTIIKEDFIKSDFASTYDQSKWQLHIAASMSYAQILNVHSSYDISKYQALLDAYQTQTTKTRIRAIGGPSFVLGDDIRQWIGNLSSNTVVIDRAGVPLHYLINPFTFPHANQTSVNVFRSELEQAINTYYAINMHVGCMTLDSGNFDEWANVAGLCLPPSTNYSFGGIYQTCDTDSNAGLCDSHFVPNILTGDYSCPPNYVAVPLQSYTFFYRLYWGIFEFWATYHTFWCAATTQVANHTGLLFGGLYTGVSNNPLTGAQSCPRFFVPVHVMTELTVCVSSDYELGHKYSVPFGGFFSCRGGNPLVNSDRKLAARADISASPALTCPNGFSQHVATIDGECLIHYCVKSNAFAGVGSIPIQLPPFKDFEAIFRSKEREIPSAPSDRGNGSVIAGIVLGAAGLVVSVVTLGFVFRKKLRRRDPSPELHDAEADENRPLLADNPGVQNA